MTSLTAESSTAGAPAARLSWRRWAGTAGGVLLGLVLLVAAWAKLLDPVAFAGQIEQEGLDFLLSAEAVAFIALGLEVGLGLALVLGLRRLGVLVPAALLVAFFLFLTGRTWWLDAHGLLDDAASCGCFGNLVDRTPKEAFWQDLVLLVPPLALAFVGRGGRGRFPWVRTAVVAVVAIGALAFAAVAPELPLDDLATRLKPGVAVGDLCAGGGAEPVCFDFVVPELAHGRHLVVLADLDDEGFRQAVPALNRYSYEGVGPILWVVSDATPEEVSAFFWQHGPAFEIREAPAALLAPLHRRLPRSFLVADGEVIETWSGLPLLDDPADLPGGSERLAATLSDLRGND